MNEINILIVEDESIVAMEIESYIKKLGYTVEDTCSNAKDALKLISEHHIDIILMDICIKGDLDGIETAIIVKKSNPQTEIIFLTAHLDDYNVDRAIEINPTAYLSKPFNREELRVFLKIALRKINKNTKNTDSHKDHIILDDEFSYDPLSRTFYCCNEIINLTKKENEFLQLLIENKNNILDFYTIENTIWPEKESNANTIRTLVKRLRQKLKHQFIETVSSRGYRFIIPQKIKVYIKTITLPVYILRLLKTAYAPNLFYHRHLPYTIPGISMPYNFFWSHSYHQGLFVSLLSYNLSFVRNPL